MGVHSLPVSKTPPFFFSFQQLQALMVDWFPLDFFLRFLDSIGRGGGTISLPVRTSCCSRLAGHRFSATRGGLVTARSSSNGYQAGCFQSLMNNNLVAMMVADGTLPMKSGLLLSILYVLLCPQLLFSAATTLRPPSSLLACSANSVRLLSPVFPSPPSFYLGGMYLKSFEALVSSTIWGSKSSPPILITTFTSYFVPTSWSCQDRV